jgi:hypothetical protein
MAETYAVALSRLLHDAVPVEPREAVAILEAIWAATAPTLDEQGLYRPIPSPGECVLTSFGDVEVTRSGSDLRPPCGPVEVATALCRVFVRLMGSGRVGDAGVPSAIAEALEPVRAQARHAARVTFESPDALLAAWSPVRVADGSAALAHLYARWEITSAPAPTFPVGAVPLTAPPRSTNATPPQTRQPVPPSMAVATPARPRPSGRIRWPARVAVPAAAAAMLTLLVAGVARVRQGSPGGEASRTSATRPADEAAPPDMTADAAVPSPSVDADDTSELPSVAPPNVGAVENAPPEPRRLVRAADVGATPYSPSFASSTGSLLFHSGLAQTALHEASLGADGRVAHVRTLVRDGARSYHVQISPDGTRMAFDSDREGERAVYIAERDGSHVRRVSGEGMALVPSWSPDGTRLAFVRADPRRPRVWQLWTMDLRINRMQQHTFHTVGQPWGGSWFPDGRRIAYSLEDTLVILDLASGVRRVYASPVPGRLVRTPAVSPDGSRIAFQVRQSGMWMLDMASGQSVRMLADRSAQEFAWSPDGRSVAYHTARGGAWEIWTVPVSGP